LNVLRQGIASKKASCRSTRYTSEKNEPIVGHDSVETEDRPVVDEELTCGSRQSGGLICSLSPTFVRRAACSAYFSQPDGETRQSARLARGQSRGTEPSSSRVVEHHCSHIGRERPYPSQRNTSMSQRKLGVAVAIGLACLTLTGCVSETGTYSSYNRVYDRSDRSDYYWTRRNRERHRDRDDHHGRTRVGPIAPAITVGPIVAAGAAIATTTHAT
jgi:hypothetical protein